MNTANIDEFFGRKKNATGGLQRNMYNQGSSVDHAVRTVDPVQDSGNKIEEVLKAYGRYRGSRKGKRPMKFKNFFELYSTENFATGGSAGQLVSNTVDGSRPGYSIGKLVTETKNELKKEIPPTRKFQLNTRLKFLEKTKLKAKNIKGSKSIANLILKKDSLGRPYFSEYLEKLNALEDLQNNKYINEKTNKQFTSKEWLELGRERGKQKDPDAFREKKADYQKGYFRDRKIKDPEFAQKMIDSKKESYFRLNRKRKNLDFGEARGVLLEERNRLLGYMSKASKDNSNYKEIMKDGKFLGVTDKSTGVNYYEAGYKGKLGKNSKLITDHPNWQETDNLVKLAKQYKVALPNKAISSYFNAYERVPTMSEMQNFLQADPRFVDKMSPNYFKTNALHLHHQVSVTDNPTEKIQLLLQDKNDQAGKKMKAYKQGIITEKQLNTELKKLNTRYFLDGKAIGAVETSPETQLKTAKAQTTKLFNKTLKANPKLVEEMTQQLGILGCPKGLQAASGGRIKFSKGTSCVIKGREVLEKGLKNGFPKNQQGDLARKILGSGKFLKDAVSLRGLFGPAALAFTVLTEAGFVASDAISGGKSFREAIGDSAFNYLLGDKTKINSEEEFIKRLKNIPGSPSQGFRGVTDEDIGKMQYFKESLKDMGVGFKNYNAIKDIEARQQAEKEGTNKDLFSENAFELEAEKNKLQADNQDYFRTNTGNRVSNYLMSDAAAEGAEALQKSNLMAEQDQLNDAYRSSLKGIESLKKEKSDIAYELSKMNNPTKPTGYEVFNPAQMSYIMSNIKDEPDNNYGLFGPAELMEGGIASLNVKK